MKNKVSITGEAMKGRNSTVWSPVLPALFFYRLFFRLMTRKFLLPEAPFDQIRLRGLSSLKDIRVFLAFWSTRETPETKKQKSRKTFFWQVISTLNGIFLRDQACTSMIEYFLSMYDTLGSIYNREKSGNFVLQYCLPTHWLIRIVIIKSDGMSVIPALGTKGRRIANSNGT